MVSAYSAPLDWNLPGGLNGFAFSRLQGSNILADGLVINHGIIHPDYMTAIMGSATNGWIYRIAGMEIPLACGFNGDRLYYALTDYKVKEGKTIYISREGKATNDLYFPEGNDWGYFRRDTYWLMDVMADLFGWDGKSTIKGKEWAAVREPEMLKAQNRGSTGQYYQDKKENVFVSREQVVAYNIAFGYLGLWLQENKMLNYTKALPTFPLNKKRGQ